MTKIFCFNYEKKITFLHRHFKKTRVQNIVMLHFMFLYYPCTHTTHFLDINNFNNYTFVTELYLLFMCVIDSKQCKYDEHFDFVSSQIWVSIQIMSLLFFVKKGVSQQKDWSMFHWHGTFSNSMSYVSYSMTFLARC